MPPIAYFETSGYAHTQLKEAGNRKPFNIYLDDVTNQWENFRLVSYPSDSFKIVFIRGSRYPSYSTLITESENPLVEGATSTCRLTKAKKKPEELKPFVKAMETSQKCVLIILKFHTLWSWYSQWRNRMNIIEDRGKAFFKAAYIPIFVMTSIALVLSCYLLSDIPNNPTSLTVSNHCGFALFLFQLFNLSYNLDVTGDSRIYQLFAISS